MKNKFNKIYISIVIIAVILLIVFVFFSNTNIQKVRNTSEFIDTNLTSSDEFKLKKDTRQDFVNIEKIDTKKNTTETEIKNISNENTDENTQDINTEKISLTAGSVVLDLNIIQGETLYDILLAKENENLIEFKAKEYPGIGFFVTDIGSLHQNNGKYLMYYINNKEASFGVSSYIPKDGDVIRWELK